jgi:uncharacterized protein YbjT (DUF2867 family)
MRERKANMKIFITGASGYIGGSIAATLIDAGHEIAGLVRSGERARQVEEHGIVPVIGTLADVEILGKAATEADAVDNTANSDDRVAVDTFLQALAGTGKTFIQ